MSGADAISQQYSLRRRQLQYLHIFLIFIVLFLLHQASSQKVMESCLNKGIFNSFVTILDRAHALSPSHTPLN